MKSNREYEASAPSYPIALVPALDSTRAKPFRGETNSLLTDDRWLCSVLERLGERPGEGREHLYGTPWLSPILGTGCLDLDDGPRVNLDLLPQLTRATLSLKGMRVPASLGDPGLLAEDFARKLFGERSHPRPAADPSAIEPTSLACLLLLAASLLTRGFHRAQMTSANPAARTPNRDVATLDGAMPADVQFRKATLPFLEELLDVLREHDPDDPRPASRKALMKRVLERLQKPVPAIFYEDLRLLTELSWLSLTRGTAIYPGWSDLLLELLVDEDGDPPTGTRPRVTDLSDMGSRVMKLLVEPSISSWATRHQRTQRNRFFSSVARLLKEQSLLHACLSNSDSEEEFHLDENNDSPSEDSDRRSRLRKELAESDPHLQVFAKEKGREPDIPHPVAFVTSFDLELEMALWTQGTPFTLVVPFLARRNRDRDGDLIWLAGTVTPTDIDARDVDLDVLRAGPSDWKLASETFAGGSGGDVPIVVRLSGSPLMTVPDTTSGTALRANLVALGFQQPGPLGSEKAPQVRLYHAMTIDEYTSLRLSESEVYYAATEPSAGSSKTPRGLPRVLSSGTTTNSRVWMGLGVQIDDPVIRTRVFAQLSAASLQRRAAQQQSRGSSGEGDDTDGLDGATTRQVEPSILGLVVNRRANDTELLGLRWLGFQIALDLDCGYLIDDLEHCAQHVEALRGAVTELLDSNEDSDWERASNDSCDLDRETRTR